jgi:hypothetical protein
MANAAVFEMCIGRVEQMTHGVDIFKKKKSTTFFDKLILMLSSLRVVVFSLDESNNIIVHFYRTTVAVDVYAWDQLWFSHNCTFLYAIDWNGLVFNSSEEKS